MSGGDGQENSDELTLRAEEVGTLKTYDWHAFWQALDKGIEGEDWGEFFDSYKEMSGAVGVKKPQEAQKSKSPLENEGKKCGRRILRSRA